MKINNNTKKLFVGFIGATLVSSSVLADISYIVSGNSMNPVLKNGELVNVVSKEYKEGDLVAAKTKDGEFIIKKIQGNLLVGESSDSLSFDIDDVEILGKVEKSTSKESNVNVLNVAEQAKALEITSPINKVYTGWEYTLFLHDDTNVTGFGRNKNNVLGMVGDDEKSTSELTKVSPDKTGFEYLQTTHYWAHGFRPDYTIETPGMYNMIRINDKLGTTSEVNDYGFPVKSGGWVHGDWSWHHSKGWIDKNNKFWIRGDDVNVSLGIGPNIPYGIHTDSTDRTYEAIAPGTRTILYDDVTFKNNNDYSDLRNTPVVTNTFTITPEMGEWELLWNFSIEPGRDWDSVDNYLKMELFRVDPVSGNETLVYSGPRTNFWRSQNHIRNPRAIPITQEHHGLQEDGTFRVKVYSNHVGWSFKVRDRQKLNWDVKKYIPGYWEGKWMVIDNADTAYIHNTGWGQLSKVNFPSGVTLQPNTVVGGKGDYYLGLDKTGQLWRWNGTTPSLVSVPTDFYTNYKIVELSAGKDHYVVVAEDNSGIKTAWVFGDNSHGELGTDTTLLPSTATLRAVTNSKGEVLKGVRSASAGGDFTVLVQDTIIDDVSTQIVYSFGKNDYGQLGGNLSLKVNEPMLVPGLSGGIDEIYAGDIYLYAQDHETKSIWRSGGSASSNMQPYSFGSLGYPKKIITNDEGNLFLMENDLGNGVMETEYYTSHSGPRQANTASYGPMDIFNGTVREQSGTAFDPDFMNRFGYLSEWFKNPRDAINTHDTYHVIDSTGRIWSYGAQDRATGTYNTYTTDGRHTVWLPEGMHAVQKTNNGGYPGTYADPIYKEIVKGRLYDRGGGSDWGRRNAYVLDVNGKVWKLENNNVWLPFTGKAIDSERIEHIFGYYESFFAVDDDGDLWSWFRNRNGQLGTGNTNAVNDTPVELKKEDYFNGEKVKQVSTHFTHTLVLTEAGNVYAMGDNSYGEIGDGTYESRLRPVKVKNLLNIQKVEVGEGFSAAIDDQGRVWAWGYAGMGALGNGFSLKRQTPSTAVGNDIPELSVSNLLQTTYLSANSTDGHDKFQFFGKIRENEGEETTINVDLLGVKKTTTITKDSWELDIYDKVKEQDWSMEWLVSEFPSGQTFQSTTKLTAEDQKGGITEQFFAGVFVVDNTNPEPSDWSQMCLLNATTKQEVSCSSEPLFQKGGTNGKAQPIRLYIKPKQKIGENKAPVVPQIRYRIKQIYGYSNNWSEWTTITQKGQNGEYYKDFFEGFLGETEIQIRGIDLAGNVSSNNATSRYIIIANAGGEIKSASAKAFSDENYGLYNQLTFVGSTPAGSAIQTYNVDRRMKLKEGQDPTDENGNPTNPWIKLTPQRTAWNGLETTFTDNGEIETFKGNTSYEYKIDAANSISVGKEKIIEVITNPYIPENLSKAPNDEGIALSISQDKRNQGSILYRLVITDNMTGSVFTKDYTSSNVNEDILFDLKGSEVFAQSGVKIVNNSIKIQVLVQGSNKQWIDVLYEENFINSPAISTDTQKPDVMFMIPELYKTIVNGKYGVDNKIQLSLFATDNVSPRHKLLVQFSLDGTNWIGLKQVSPTQKEWIANHWSTYQDLYGNFAVGQTTGKKMIYVRVQDEAGNVTYANTEVVITDPLNRVNPGSGTSTPINDPTNGTVITDFTDTTERHVRNPNTKITVPKDGNLTEVQFSFDGVEWSPWEKIGDSGLSKYITLDYGNGNRTIMVRYKNDSGLITDLDSNKDIITYVLDQEKPTGEIKTRNGTLLSTKFAVPFKFFVEDNLSSQVKVSVVGQNENGQPFTLNKVYVNAQGEIDVNTNADGFITGNKVVLNVGTTNYYGVVGLVPNKFNEVRFKLEDKAGNLSYKTIRIFYKQ